MNPTLSPFFLDTKLLLPNWKLLLVLLRSSAVLTILVLPNVSYALLAFGVSQPRAYEIASRRVLSIQSLGVTVGSYSARFSLSVTFGAPLLRLCAGRGPRGGLPLDLIRELSMLPRCAFPAVSGYRRLAGYLSQAAPCRLVLLGGILRFIDEFGYGANRYLLALSAL